MINRRLSAMALSVSLLVLGTAIIASVPAGASARSHLAKEAAMKACQEFRSRIAPDLNLPTVSIVANIVVPSDGVDPVAIVKADASRAALLSSTYRQLKSDASLLYHDAYAAAEDANLVTPLTPKQTSPLPPPRGIREDAGLVKDDCRAVAK
jgi:hypothetical protein